MATRNRNRNRDWDNSGNYGREYNTGAYYDGSTYRERGSNEWPNNYDEGGNNDRWQRRYGEDDRDYNENKSRYSRQGYYGNQGLRGGESGSWGNRDRENDYENRGTSWGDSYSSNYRSSYRGFPDYEDYEQGAFGNSGSRYRNYGGNYGRSTTGNHGQGSRLGNSDYYGGSRNQGYGYGQRGYGNSYGSGNYGAWRQDEGEDRGWWDKTTDEVSSWFGDEDAERRRDQDRRREGMHRGKGPKGYQRSDDRIKDDINDRLSDDPFVDASNIDVTVSNGEVMLTGTVFERSDKRRAEDIAESVSGVRNVEVRLRVQDEYSSSYRTGASATGATAGTSAGAERMKNKQSTLTETK